MELQTRAIIIVFIEFYWNFRVCDPDPKETLTKSDNNCLKLQSQVNSSNLLDSCATIQLFEDSGKRCSLLDYVLSELSQTTFIDAVPYYAVSLELPVKGSHYNEYDMCFSSHRKGVSWSKTYMKNESCKLTTAEDIRPIIKTNSGIVMGRHIKSYNGRVVSAFEGIPYAQPPVGSLRFEKPKPIDKWSHVLIANKTYTCIHQRSQNFKGAVIGTEDCLYLYIYVPRETIAGNENFDVVVGIHSGAFMRGDPHTICGEGYLMDRDLVYVSFNYRLAMLGFLSTEDDVVPGNNGMKDQVLALRWINDNIQYFGGNPKSITLVGVSAGGASVHFHYLSPMSRDLFHRGISLSGTALNSWALIEQPAKKARQLAGLFDCPEHDSHLLVDCLRLVDATSLSATAEEFYVMTLNLPITSFGPVVEKGIDSFLYEHPYKLLLKGKMKHAPWITSNTLNEGMFPAGPFVKFDVLETLNEVWNDAMAPMIDCNDTVDNESKTMLAKKLREYYLNNETLSMGNINRLIDLFSDRLFKVDAEKAIRLQAKVSKSPVYYYLFTYNLEMRESFPDKIFGVSHMDDVRLLHPVINNPDVLSTKDETLKNMFIDFVADFASGKNVTFGNTVWLPVDSKLYGKNMHYLHIDGPESVRIKTVKNLAPMRFWNDLPIKENQYLFSNRPT